MKGKPKKQGNVSRTKPRSTNAPGPYLGFSLQSTRFLVRLLEADPGDVICLEEFEDVGVEKPDGTRIAEQTKSNTASNPLADRSVAFWKTIRNWVEMTQLGKLDPDNTYFEIYTSHPAVGSVADSFNKADSIDSALGAFGAARERLGQKNAASMAERDQPQNLSAHLRHVFAADPQLIARIIVRMKIKRGSGDPFAELRRLMLKELVSEEAYEDVLLWAHGWVKQKIDQLIALGQPAKIAHAVFHEALLNYVRTHDRLDILRSMGGKPTEAQIRTELNLRNYIRQLSLIRVDDVDNLAAVNDFLRAAADRTFWAEKGLVSESSLGEFGAELTATWRNKKDKVSIGYSDKEDYMQGRLLYRECMDHSVRVDGLETPPHFTRGSLHSLADELVIGWHPKYREELTREMSSPPSTSGE